MGDTEIAYSEELYVRNKEIDTIISNYYRYYEAFAQSGIIQIHRGDVSWMMPKTGKKGPALGFGIHLKEETAKTGILQLAANIRAGRAPQLWHITPDATPEGIISLMEKNGFSNLSVDAPEPEPTMLLKKEDFCAHFLEDVGVGYRSVRTKEDFGAWVDVVNTALHGWDMIDAKNYYVWVENPDIRLYLGEIDGVLVSTAATICHGDTASLEFVSTLEGYRRKKAAVTVCSNALAELFAAGVRTVTLGACGESVHLYRKLGFRSYFNNVIMKYDG